MFQNFQMIRQDIIEHIEISDLELMKVYIKAHSEAYVIITREIYADSYSELNDLFGSMAKLFLLTKSQ